MTNNIKARRLAVMVKWLRESIDDKEVVSSNPGTGC